MEKILDVKWFSTCFGVLIGIVTIFNGYETKSYIGIGDGLDEQIDIASIVRTGARIFPNELEHLLNFYKEEKK